MTNETKFSPNWASPPGSTIQTILREQNLSALDLSNRLQWSEDEVTRLLDGHTPINFRIARKLSTILGSSVEFWISRDFYYRQVSTKLRRTEEQWLNTLPIDDMVRFGWLKQSPLPNQQVQACLEFFGVSDLSTWKRSYSHLDKHIGFRTSRSYHSTPGSVAAWLRQGEIEASSISCAPWDPAQLRKSIPAIRSLTRQKNPSVFMPLLQSQCASSGVAVTVVRAPHGCRASGAVRFLTQRKAILQLSARYLVDDQFWFSFFHEIGHLLLQEPREIILDHFDKHDTENEDEANEFAAYILIPPEYRSMMLNLPNKPRDIIKFARTIGIAPGIAVGQLQYIGKLKYSHMNNLKRRYKWTG